MYSDTLIQQHYIILSKDVEYYRDIYVLDTEGYNVEFLVNNSIFDIVSWNIDEEGYGVTMDDLIHDVVESIMLE